MSGYVGSSSLNQNGDRKIIVHHFEEVRFELGPASSLEDLAQMVGPSEIEEKRAALISRLHDKLQTFQNTVVHGQFTIVNTRLQLSYDAIGSLGCV